MRSHFGFVSVVAFLLLLFSPASHAQAIPSTVFTVTGTFPGNNGVTFAFAPGSTIAINTSTGLVTASNISITLTGDQYTLSNLTVGGPNEIFWANSSAFGSLLILPVSSFTGFTGGPAKLAEYIPDPKNVYDSSNTTLTANCNLGLSRGSLQVWASGLSRSLFPTEMNATFAPPRVPPNLVSNLAATAQACGYTGFDWQQIIEAWPFPIVANCRNLCLAAHDRPTQYLYAPPAFYDPPDGSGYTYMDSSGLWDIFLGAFPFYYNALGVQQPPYTDIDGSTLHFYDQPRDPLPGFNFMAFKTSLVGLRAEGGYDTLATWDWNTDYTGQVGGILSIQQSASIAPDDFSGTGGVTITGMNGMPVTTFSAFRNKLETTRIGFELTSHFTLGSGSGGINPPAENVLLAVGSYVVMVPAGSFSKNREGDFVYEGTIGGEHLELRIVPGTANEYTLRAEASGTATITLGTRPAVELMIGNDMGVGTGKDKET